MNCARCQADTKVTDSRPASDGVIKRRRQCGSCGFRFSTWESAVSPAAVLKHRQSNAARGRRYWNGLTPERRAEIKHREHTRARARDEARDTGQPVAELYRRWGVE